ncbi:LIVCS family branched-chain amino acid:cation transporter [Scopulibacillus daqui]|uniref:Branched-chain amino acid transport system carrier protein n=1 Tax=Scopulibacillus daqui TaxID=1469162 RepID=A0ABS2Q0H3_9BACL|nr:LIVCS family branched-chain amino acid:cation transporter [Scopulibacillus daqui]
MDKKFSFKDTFFIGLMMFALFFGAGNMIFPPSLGQDAGTNVWVAILGFLITGVGLPLCGVIAVSISGSSLRDLSNKVHPVFGVIFTSICFLVIGPFFATPRTGTVAFEIGVTPFLPPSVHAHGLPLAIYTIIFFGVTLWLCLNPTKLVDRIGKILTPVLLLVIAIIVVKGIIHPIDHYSQPVTSYAAHPFFNGFLHGYLTMDAIASLIFGIVVTKAVKDKGITSQKKISKVTIGSGIIAAIGLALVYISLAFIGATSKGLVGQTSNGGDILTTVTQYLYGGAGQMLLALAITFACLTTAIGLITSCAEYFSNMMPKISYRWFVVIFSAFSALVANVGLTQLIMISAPVLTAIYPLTIVLIILTFIDKSIGVSRGIYVGALIGAGVISIFDGLKGAGIQFQAAENLLGHLPLYTDGMGWLIPAFVCGIIGLVISKLKASKTAQRKNAA